MRTPTKGTIMPKSRADKVLIEEGERLMTEVVRRAKSSNQSVNHILETDLLLCGQVMAIVNIFLELPHLSIDSPIADEFLTLAL
jgi:hypothetical protein